MNSLFWLFSFISLFIGLCMFVIMAIASYNILTKSYRPKNSILIILVTGLIFFASGFYTLNSINRLITNIGLESGIVENNNDIQF